jgi:tetratricopeptide (TPR) repeat protein
MLGQALALHQEGRIDEAERIYRWLIAVNPRQGLALAFLGIAAAQRGNPEEALQLLDRSIRIDPRQPVVHFNRGNVLRDLARWKDALQSYGRALALAPEMAEAHYNRGIVLRRLERPAEALESYDRALALAPRHAQAHVNRANVLADLGRREEALAGYTQALALEPGIAAVHANRGSILMELDRPAEAAEDFRIAVEREPGDPEFLCSLGTALLALGRTEAAAARFEAAVALAPDHRAALYNRGTALLQLNRRDEALADLGRVLELDPAHVDAAYNMGIALLSLGRYAEGWPLYENRWRASRPTRCARRIAAPPWLGREEISGRRLLLHSEQGAGDVIQFARYAPLLAARGARVVLDVPPSLQTLMATLDGVEEVMRNDRDLPVFDLHCPLLSLPLACGTAVETIPASAPYLRVDPERSAVWRERLGPPRGPRVGLVWSGNPEHLDDARRSIPLAMLAPLIETGASFFALQPLLRGDDAAALAGLPTLRNLGPDLADYADTAAVIDQLDLVIAVDTSVVHLAGALGRPVWVMLPFAPDWRWLLEREDSPWYPTARLYRQGPDRAWAPVIERVAAALREAAAPPAFDRR